MDITKITFTESAKPFLFEALGITIDENRNLLMNNEQLFSDGIAVTTKNFIGFYKKKPLIK
ncbi:MAG: hypothetical protein ABIP51_17875 [Bacteroidia bacterium]